jgi:hypothetical protein
MPTYTLTDREEQVTKAALDFFRNAKQLSIQGELPFKGSTGEYDLMSPEHTLMHTITALAKLTQLPPAHFANRNPSQLTSGAGLPPVAEPSELGTQKDELPPNTSTSPSGAN